MVSASRKLSATRSSATHSRVFESHRFPALASWIASGVFIAPRTICVTPTVAPTTGRTTALAIPAASPLAKPEAPSVLAPRYGAAKSAAVPASTPFPVLCSPEDRPDITFCGRRSEKTSLKSTSEASAEPESVPLGTPAYAVSAPDISDIIALV